MKKVLVAVILISFVCMPFFVDARAKRNRFVDRLDTGASNFVVGYLKYKSGKFGEAKVRLQEAVSNLPLLRDYSTYFLGKSCLELSDYECAHNSFGDIVQNSPESVWFQMARWGEVESLAGSGNYSGALLKLNRIKPSIADDLSDAEYGLMKAVLFRKLNRTKEAAGILQDIYFSAASEEAMNNASQALKEMGNRDSRDVLKYIRTSPAQIQLAENMIVNYRFDEGFQILRSLEDKQGGSHMTEILAKSYFKAREYEKAKGLYLELTSRGKGKRNVHYLLKLAQAASRTDDFDLAIKTYKRLKKSSNGKSQLKYKYKLGFLYMDSGKYDLARDIFLDIANSKYRGHLRKNVLWRLAWCYWRLGQYEDAVVYFGKVADGGFGKKYRLKAAFWQAKALAKTGAMEAARLIYSQLVEKNKFSYYGFIAAKELYHKRSIPNEWLILDDASVPQNPPLPAGLDKAKLLVDLGLTDFAAKEVAKFNRRQISSKSGAIAFMNFAAKVGDYRSANLASVGFFKSLLGRFPYGDGLRRYVWKKWYPEAYPEFVKKYTGKFKVDGRLATSIMREESRFQPAVVSKADAIGLMQIIPPTGRKLAEALGDKTFQPPDLFRPETNIKFGTKYLGELAEMFDGEKVYMIASYNAGEKAVGRWVKSSDAVSIEEFIEEIPYDETNEYVKRVLKTYWIYKELYDR